MTNLEKLLKEVEVLLEYVDNTDPVSSEEHVDAMWAQAETVRNLL